MSIIRKRVVNTNTGKVIYEGVIASGTYEDLYDKLLKFAKKTIMDHFYPDDVKVVHSISVYNYEAYHHWKKGQPYRLLKSFGNPYFQFSDSGAMSYIFTIL